MKILHIALECKSEQNADRFYSDLLGLEKSEPKLLPSELSEAIFGVSSEIKVLNYLDAEVRFEIFVHERPRARSCPIEHVCLEVGDLAEFLQRCRSLGMKIIQVPKGDYVVTFIKDLDGNLFEIKEKTT